MTEQVPTPPTGGTRPVGVPTCYRHPGRETYVRCSRCDRPICPDCMSAASVGFHCPECVREGRATQRQGRTALGGRVDLRAGAVSEVLIAINVAMFLMQQVSTTFTDRFVMIPGIHGFVIHDGRNVMAGVVNGEYYRLLTSMFLHTGVIHILFNMWALWVVGPPLERLLGRSRFLALYFLSGLAGSTLVYLLVPANQAVLGASGAIFGLFGALFVIGRRMQFGDLRWIGGIIAVNLVITFAIPNISWQGHLGGLVIGSALAAAYAYAPRHLRAPIAIVASVAVAALIVVAVLLRTAALT